MEYVLHASAVLAIFYICYRLFLQQETFYDANRWFLLLGLATSVLFPLMAIPMYIEVPLTPSTGLVVMATTTQHSSEAFNTTSLFIWMYPVGVCLFLGRFIVQLFSLIALISKHDKKKIDGYILIETAQKTTPFSFFNWIVYNPTQFDAQERYLILHHEKIHAAQKHSIDVLIMDLTTALFWCNPIIWLYRKAVKQNLEFIADHNTQKQSRCEKRYQKLLLKTSVCEKKLISINTFYNSTIKKRIVMLHKSKSNLMNSWKYSIIVPLLVIFALTFNTKTIAKTTYLDSEASTYTAQNELELLVNKDTKDQEFDAIINRLAEKGATIIFNNIKRDSRNQIIGIKIVLNHKGSKIVYSKKSSDPIRSIKIVTNTTSGNLTIIEQPSESSSINPVKVIGDSTKDNHKEESVISKKQPLVIVEGSEIDQDKMDTIDPETIESITVFKDASVIEKYGQKAENGVVLIKRKNNYTEKIANEKRLSIVGYGEQKVDYMAIAEDGKNPLYIKDGKEISKEAVDAMDHKKIASIHILKDDHAFKEYGEKGKDGVVVISTKKNGNTISVSNNKKEPLYIVDGKEVTKKETEKIESSTIGSIDVLKDEHTTKKYGEKGKNDVVLITTKKKD